MPMLPIPTPAATVAPALPNAAPMTRTAARLAAAERLATYAASLGLTPRHVNGEVESAVYDRLCTLLRDARTERETDAAEAEIADVVRTIRRQGLVGQCAYLLTVNGPLDAAEARVRFELTILAEVCDLRPVLR